MSRLSSTGDTPTAELASDHLREALIDRLRSAIGDALVDSYLVAGVDVWVRVRADAWRQAGLALRDQLGMDYFCYLSAIDWMPSPFGRSEDDPTAEVTERDDTIRQGYAGGETRFQMLARVVSSSTHVGTNSKADVSENDLTVESWLPVYTGANWHERETWEMFGINFAGHPDLRHMYLPTEFEGFPLRKDFPLLARLVKPWPGIADVEPMPGVSGDDEGGE
ncbi:MAG: NADH-quinone oxidoreductase subunit C [Actinomycetota bacterium]